MKRTILTICFAVCCIVASAQNIMKKQADGTCIVNSSELCKARGYKDKTPLEVHIKGGKVVKIEPLPNKETPKYFKIVTTKYLPKFVGLKVAKALGIAVQPECDACTGATFSGKAVQQNIKAALDYYRKNK